MAAHRREEIEQRLIDHEVWLSTFREAEEIYAAGQASRRDVQRGAADRRWYRRELVAMLSAARTEREARELGLSDAVVREARLGDTLLQAWARFRPQHLPPPRVPERTEARAPGRTHPG